MSVCKYGDQQKKVYSAFLDIIELNVIFFLNTQNILYPTNQCVLGICNILY